MAQRLDADLRFKGVMEPAKGCSKGQIAAALNILACFVQICRI